MPTQKSVQSIENDHITAKKSNYQRPGCVFSEIRHIATLEELHVKAVGGAFLNVLPPLGEGFGSSIPAFRIIRRRRFLIDDDFGIEPGPTLL